MSALEERLGGVMEQVADAARAADRDPAAITTIVVTKFHPPALVRELAALGVRDLGENRHQEAQAKAAELADLDLRWHFIGQLQGNKARAVRGYASAIHSIDRPSLVADLGSGDPLDVFVQVDLSGDPGRGGVDPVGLPGLVDAVLTAPDLRLRGLMTVAPLDVEPARAFAHLRALGERTRAVAPDATALSMGMSEDFREAIREGATHLRIGTAITGNRPTAG
jgi:pyridoxal phosphate enzyme (YggS family)